MSQRAKRRRSLQRCCSNWASWRIINIHHQAFFFRNKGKEKKNDSENIISSKKKKDLYERILVLGSKNIHGKIHRLSLKMHARVTKFIIRYKFQNLLHNMLFRHVLDQPSIKLKMLAKKFLQLEINRKKNQYSLHLKENRELNNFTRSMLLLQLVCCIGWQNGHILLYNSVTHKLYHNVQCYFIPCSLFEISFSENQQIIYLKVLLFLLNVQNNMLSSISIMKHEKRIPS